MKNQQSKAWQSLITEKKLQTLVILEQLVQPLNQSSRQISTLVVAAGLSLSMGIPALAFGIASSTQSSPSNSQLLSQQPKQAKKVEITLVSYAVTQAAYAKIIPQFVAKWKKERKQDVVIEQSYGGSGSQTRAVIDGLEADVVALALAGDVQKIQKSGLINAGWEKEAPNEAIVTRSVAALVTRQGNPKKIRNWTDLAKPGIGVITANPKTSGGARWNFLALWGSVTKTGGNEQKARQFVTQVYKNVPVLPKDAREATDIFFKQGQGDVLINYENEVILAKLNGQKDFSYTVPTVNISIDNPVAIVDKNVDKHKSRQVAEAFVQFLYTPEAQREFAKVGFRPVNATVAKETASKFPKVNNLFNIQGFGGWDAIDKKFFASGAIFDQIVGNQR